MPRRDMDLVRDLLLKIEAIDDPKETFRVELDGRSKHEVEHHLQLLRDACLVTWTQESVGDVTWRAGYRLTWDGHEFLDNARNETVWADAKKALSDGAVKSAAFGIWTTILSQIVAKNLGLD